MLALYMCHCTVSLRAPSPLGHSDGLISAASRKRSVACSQDSLPRSSSESGCGSCACSFDADNNNQGRHCTSPWMAEIHESLKNVRGFSMHWYRNSIRIRALALSLQSCDAQGHMHSRLAGYRREHFQDVALTSALRHSDLGHEVSGDPSNAL